MSVMQVEFSSPESWCKRLGNFQPVHYAPTRSTRARVVRPAQHSIGASAGLDDDAVWPLADAMKPGAAHARRVKRRTTWALHVVALMFGLLIAASLVWVPLASAQMGGGGGGMGGGHGGHGGQPGAGSQSRTPVPGNTTHAPNPLRAMLIEAHNLRADLMLNASQIEPWSAMEDSLRRCIELNRSRMPEPTTSANLDPLVFAQDYADNEHSLADASAKFVTALQAVMAALNPRQRQTSTERFAAAIAAETASTVAP